MLKRPEHAKNRSNKLTWLFVVVSFGFLLDVFGLALSCIGKWLDTGDARDTPALIFHSPRPYGEVEVPFTNRAGHIVVQATLAGKTVDCLVDTGVQEIVWQNMDVPYRPSNRWFSYAHPSGHYVRAQWVNLSSVRIGGFELPRIDTIYVPGQQPPLTWTLDNYAVHVILGNHAFKNIVLTIDYQRSVLILRRPDYDMTHQPRRPQDCLVEFTPEGKHVDYSPEYLSVGGQVEGHNVRFVVDTGHSGPGLLLSPETRKQLTSVPYGTPPTFPYYIFGRPVTEVTRSLRWSIGSAQGACPGWVMKLWPDWQANMGYEVLKNYRVTIDYPRHCLLLEPYGNTSPGEQVVSGVGKGSTGPAFSPGSGDPRAVRVIINRVVPVIPPGYCYERHPDGSVEIYPCSSQGNRRERAHKRE